MILQTHYRIEGQNWQRWKHERLLGEPETWTDLRVEGQQVLRCPDGDIWFGIQTEEELGVWHGGGGAPTFG